MSKWTFRWALCFTTTTWIHWQVKCVWSRMPIVDLDPNEAEMITTADIWHWAWNKSWRNLGSTIAVAESMIYGAIIDAKTAEMAGMTAMQKQLQIMLKSYQWFDYQYNRARQAAITQEITEIVAGASAQNRLWSSSYENELILNENQRATREASRRPYLSTVRRHDVVWIRFSRPGWAEEYWYLIQNGRSR